MGEGGEKPTDWVLMLGGWRGEKGCVRMGFVLLPPAEEQCLKCHTDDCGRDFGLLMIVNQFGSNTGQHLVRGRICSSRDESPPSAAVPPLAADVCVEGWEEDKEDVLVLNARCSGTTKALAAPASSWVLCWVPGRWGIRVPSISSAEVIKALPACHRAYGTS